MSELPPWRERLAHFAQAMYRVVLQVTSWRKPTVPPEVYKRRREICSACPTGNLVAGKRSSLGDQCGLCGCNIPAKAMLATERCDDGHWAMNPTGTPDEDTYIRSYDLYDLRASLLQILPPDCQTVQAVVAISEDPPTPAALSSLARSFTHDMWTLDKQVLLRVKNVLPQRPRLLLLDGAFTWRQILKIRQGNESDRGSSQRD